MNSNTTSFLIFPETVPTHEIGHQLDYRYPEFHDMLKDKTMIQELRDLASRPCLIKHIRCQEWGVSECSIQLRTR